MCAPARTPKDVYVNISEIVTPRSVIVKAVVPPRRGSMILAGRLLDGWDGGQFNTAQSNLIYRNAEFRACRDLGNMADGDERVVTPALRGEAGPAFGGSRRDRRI